MARRRSKTSATGGNLDSMLDTLTNVVGILVIVLVTVQLSSQEAASRIAATAITVDPDEVAKLERDAAAAHAAAMAAATALAREQAAAKNPAAEVARLETEAATAERKAREAADKAAAEEKKRTQEREAARVAAERAAAATAAEAAKRQAARDKAAAVVKDLQARLASLPLPVAPPAKQVRLPDPRPAPKDAKELRVLCRDGRVWVVDIPGLQEPAKKRADYVVKRKKLDPDGDTWLADGKMFVDEFNESPVREDGFEMTLAISGGKWPQLVLTRMPSSGQTAAEAIRSTSPLARTLRRLGADDHYVRFYVWPDGFEAYLEVRDFVAERGFAAGWEPVTSKDEHRISLGRYAIGTKPPPGGTSAPKPVENVLD